MPSLVPTLTGSLKSVLRRTLRHAQGLAGKDTLAMSTTAFAYKFVILVRRIKAMVKQMAAKEV